MGNSKMATVTRVGVKKNPNKSGAIPISLLNKRLNERIKEIHEDLEMITQHSRGLEAEEMANSYLISELLSLQHWIENDGCRLDQNSMSLSDVLQYGKNGEVYRASSSISKWNGAEIQVYESHQEDGIYTVLLHYNLPKVEGGGFQIGSPIQLIGAITKARWGLVGVKPIVESNARKCIQNLVLVIGKTLRLFFMKNKQLPFTNGNGLQYRLEIEEAIRDVLMKSNARMDDFVANLPERKVQFSMFLEKLRFIEQFVIYMSDEQLIEHGELILSLIYYFCHEWWGLGEWDSRMFKNLNNEEMMLTAKSFIEEMSH